jgi:hypothetical protein
VPAGHVVLAEVLAKNASTGHNALVGSRRWWVFDRPLLRDPLFVVGLVIGLVGIVLGIPRLGDMGWLAAVVSVVLTIPFALLLVGIVGGVVREYRGGRAARA